MKRVIHLSTWDKMGGAAIAAWRLHQGLRDAGVDSRMVVRHRSWPGEDVSVISSEIFEASDVFQRRVIQPAQPEGATLFTVEPTTVPLMEHPWIAEADVVHLHWVSCFLGIEDIEALCLAGKTVFWTFHAEWAFTGGCQYIGGTRRLPEDWDGSSQIDESLHPMVRREFLRKKEVFGSLPIHVIAPSRWMAEEAAASGVFPAERIHVVPYGLDASVFSPTKAAESGPVSLVFGCQSLAERRKGFRELREALTLCMEDPRFSDAVGKGEILLKTFGGAASAGWDLPVPGVHLGMIGREERIATILRDSSAFLCPTLDDNLPNVVMESLACGRPVLGFATGGLPDMVVHGGNGLLAPCGDVAALARHLLEFSLDPDLRQRLTDGAGATDLSRWTLEAQARHMLSLYDGVSPSQPSGSAAGIPESCPTVTLEGRILPDFETQVTRALLEEIREIREREVQQKAQPVPVAVNPLEARVARLKEKLDAEKKKSKTLQKRLQVSENKARGLQERLASKPKSLFKRIKSMLTGR